MLRYDPDLLDRFPTLRATAMELTGVVNGPSPQGLVDDFRTEQSRTRQQLQGTTPSEVASVAAWRQAFRAFGVSPTQYRSAIEALLRRVTKQGSIPTINTLVDMGNLAALRARVPVAVFDLDRIDGELEVTVARGTETFLGLRAGSEELVDAGEVIFRDAAGTVCARRWCWGQNASSATGPETTRALVVIEGHHAAADTDTEDALATFAELIARYLPDATTRRLTLDGLSG